MKRLLKEFVVFAVIMGMALSVIANTVSAPEAEAEMSTEEKQAWMAAQTAKLTKDDISMLRGMFNAEYFATRYPEIAAAVENNQEMLFQYFVNFGIWEERDCSPDFSYKTYYSSNADLREAFGNDIISYYRHFVTNGKNEGRIASGLVKSTASTLPVVTENSAEVFSNLEKSVAENDKRKERIAELERQAAELEKQKTLETEEYSKFDEALKALASQIQAEYDKQAEEDARLAEEYRKAEELRKREEALKEQERLAKEAQKTMESMTDLWEKNKPQPQDFFTEAELEAYNKQYKQWENSKPGLEDYKVGYKDAKAASEAYAGDYSEWEKKKPDITGFTNPELNKAYVNACQNWENSKPKVENFTSILLVSHVENLNYNQAVKKYEDDLNKYNSDWDFGFNKYFYIPPRTYKNFWGSEYKQYRSMREQFLTIVRAAQTYKGDDINDLQKFSPETKAFMEDLERKYGDSVQIDEAAFWNKISELVKTWKGNGKPKAQDYFTAEKVVDSNYQKELNKWQNSMPDRNDKKFLDEESFLKALDSWNANKPKQSSYSYVGDNGDHVVVIPANGQSYEDAIKAAYDKDFNEWVLKGMDLVIAKTGDPGKGDIHDDNYTYNEADWKDYTPKTEEEKKFWDEVDAIDIDEAWNEILAEMDKMKPEGN